MKVQELRTLLNSADKVHLEKVTAEFYKLLPKVKKEEADQMIADILADKAKSAKKKAEPLVDFEECKFEIEEFIENAYAQNYFAPNRTIPKSQRSKWRFMVKNFVKTLEKIPAEDPDCAAAAVLLKELYQVVCEACNCYLFSTEDPFRSVGILQTEFCQTVFSKTFLNGYTRENIREMLKLVTHGGLDRETVHSDMEILLLAALKTSDTKYTAIEEAKVLVKENEEKLRITSEYDGSGKAYQLKVGINELCDMIIMLGIKLGEAEDEIKYHFQHYKDYDVETALYSALHVAYLMEADSVWIRIYEYGMELGIQPREQLRQQYESRREIGDETNSDR